MPQTPPNAPKLHLNENLSPSLAIQLRKHGIDVTSSHEENLLTEPDDRQLPFAVSQQRAIVTFNIADFIDLHNQYMTETKEHYGIILSTEVPLGVLFNRLLRLLNSISVNEMKNQIRWLNEFK